MPQPSLLQSSSPLVVTASDGEREPFDETKLRATFLRVSNGLDAAIDIEGLTEQCQASLYDGVSVPEVNKAAVLSARAFMEKDPVYSFMAARLLLESLYREVLGRRGDEADFAKVYRETFIKNLKRGVAIGRLDARVLDFDLGEISEALDPARDLRFAYLGLQTLYDRYLVRDVSAHAILETPQMFWMRVAIGLALLEEDKTSRVKEFYEAMSTFRFVPSTPTLFHAATTHPQLSSCYLTTVDDSLNHIFKSIGDNAQLSKWSGGLGNDWTNLRGTGALIKGTGVESQGVIPFLKIANDTTVAINRSGKRRGATCAYLETWHIDIEDFLELRKNTGDERRRTHDMDTANWIPDLFMKRVVADGEWTLFSPEETPELHHLYGRAFEEKYEEYERFAKAGKLRLTRSMRACDLWKKMLTMLFETGHPWVTFKDPCNIRSPQDHVGVVHSSNLCTEITLNTSFTETAVCNLGSINYVAHIKGKRLDKELLKRTVTTAMRMLDNVIDINFYPTTEAEGSNLKHRPVGLGVMGFQDALYLLDIDFASEEAIVFADQSMEIIAYHAVMASSELAKERGAYASFQGSKWDRGIFPIDAISLLEEERGESIPVARTSILDWTPVRESVAKHGMRNSNCLAIAPTATISNIVGSIPSIEPIYKNIYVKSNMSGEFTEVNEYLIADLKKLGLWNEGLLAKLKYHDGVISKIEEIPLELKAKYKEAFEIDPRWLIKIAAHRGKWLDQSQSLNLFFRSSSGKDLSDLYLYAWKLGLKTTYYLRTLAVSQVEKATVNTAEFGSTHTREFAATPFGSEVSDQGSVQNRVIAVGQVCEACQ